MCVFTHFAAGALLGAYAPFMWLAPVFGLGSHVALDVLPHYDFEDIRVEIVLWLVAMGLLLVGGVYSFAVIAGGLAGVLPDLENLLWKTGVIGEDKKFFPGHSGVIPHGPKAGKFNLTLQFVLSAAVLGFLVWRGA